MLKETNEQKLMKVFFDFPTEKFHLRELARKTKLNPNTVIRTVKRLSKDGLIVSRKKIHLVEVFVNRNNEFKILKKIENIKRLYNSEIVDNLVEKFHPSLISVIGSYSTGDDIELSDIDLVIVSKEKKDFRVKNYEKKLKRKIHLIVSDYNSFSDEFYTNLINGIILYGFVERK